MSESQQPVGEGFLHLLPMFLKEGVTVSYLQAGVLPWGSPSHMAVVGHDESSANTALMVIAYEWPSNWLRTVKSFSKTDLEWLHVQRFRADHVAALGQHAFWSVEAGADPPDISAAAPGGPLGIECTRLTLPSRQKAHGLFRAVRQRIASVPPEHFAALSGNIVYLWFNDTEASLGLPFKRSDDEAARDLVEALAAYQPDSEKITVVGDQLPDSGPPLPLHQTDSGAAFYCVPMTNAAPDSLLFNFAGFELGMAFTSTHHADAEWADLTTLIQRKDRAGSEWLLISAGAPDAMGLIYPSEEALVEFLLDNPQELPNLEHLSRVTLHLWGSGRAVDLWPKRRDVFGPLYQGVSVAHRPLPLDEAQLDRQ